MSTPKLPPLQMWYFDECPCGQEEWLEQVLEDYAIAAIESAACADRDARIAELERELAEARAVIKDIGLLLHHLWCNVHMSEYSFEKLNKGMESIDAAMQKDQQ